MRTFEECVELLTELKQVSREYADSSFKVFGDSSGSFSRVFGWKVFSFVNFDVLYNKLQKLIDQETQVSVKLNEEYTAQVTDTEVIVDDQKISFEAIRELYKAIELKINSNRIGQKVPFYRVRIGEYITFNANSLVYQRVEAPSSTATLIIVKTGERAYFTPTDGQEVTIVAKP